MMRLLKQSSSFFPPDMYIFSLLNNHDTLNQTQTLINIKSKIGGSHLSRARILSKKWCLGTFSESKYIEFGLSYQEIKPMNTAATLLQGKN